MRFPCSMWEIGNRHTSLSQSSGEIKNGPAKMKGFLLIMISWFDYDDWIAVFPQHSWFHLLQDLSSNLNLVTTELVWLPCLPKRKPEPPGATWPPTRRVQPPLQQPWPRFVKLGCNWRIGFLMLTRGGMGLPRRGIIQLEKAVPSLTLSIDAGGVLLGKLASIFLTSLLIALAFARRLAL